MMYMLSQVLMVKMYNGYIMSNRVTRDHHNLRRNLKLNGKYISNDGGDEGISIADDGDVTMTSNDTHLKLAYNGSNYTTMDVASNGVLEISSTGGTAADADQYFLAGNGAAANYFKGQSTTFYPSSIGVQSIQFNLTGAPTLILNSQAVAGDEFKFTCATNGVSTISTVDSDGEAAHLTLAPDGDCIIDRNTALTATGTAKGLHIDYDHTGIAASVQTITGIALDIDMNCETVTHVGAVNNFGIDLDMTASADGTQIQTGMTMNIAGSDKTFGLLIDTDGVASSTGIVIDNKNGGIDFQNKSSVDGGDYFSISTIASGATTLATVDDGDSGDGVSAHLTLDIDGDITLDAHGKQIYFAYNETNLVDFDLNTCIHTFRHTTNTDDLFYIKVEAEGATTLKTTDDDTAVGHLTLNPDGDLIVDSHSGQTYFKHQGDPDDYFKLSVSKHTGETTLETVSADADGHINIEADGHVEFDNCAVGFDKLAGAFGTSGVSDDGGHSTDIDFRLSNKYELELGASMSATDKLNLIFPATSGNFIFVISQDGTGSRTIHEDSWVAYQSDGSTEATNAAFTNSTDGDIRWAGGGSAPTLTATADRQDIVSIYWDADNQTAFAVISLDFR